MGTSLSAAREEAGAIYPGMINEAAKQKLVLYINLGIDTGCENLSTIPCRGESYHEVVVSVGRAFSLQGSCSLVK